MAGMAGICDSLERNGRTYVVQTEDKAPPAGLIETAVFEGGRIVHVRRTSYLARAEAAGFAAELAQLMAEQHREVRSDVERGRFDGIPGGKGT